MIEELLFNTRFLLIYLFMGIFLLTFFLLPRIREVNLRLNIYDSPDDRSSHSKVVPTLGGISFYISFMFALFCLHLFEDVQNIVAIIFSLTIIFFTGLKDDLHALSAKKKLLGQIIAVTVLMLDSEFRINSFHGFLGVYQLNEFVSIGFTSFLFLGLINAYNLIDGIDGMASIVGVVIAISFGFLYYKLGLHFYMAFCITIIASLLAFLRFNFSSKKKIFMGDTGALLLGLVFGMLTTKLLSLDVNTFSLLHISRKELTLLIICIAIIPVFDVVRVMCIRFNRKVPIFSPDRNHIHHVLIDSGLSHKRASIFIGFINITIIIVMFNSIRYFNINVSITVFLVLVLNLIVMFFIMNKSRNARRMKVRLRHFLFNIVKAFYFSRRKNHVEINRVSFNEKLKKIRFFFF